MTTRHALAALLLLACDAPDPVTTDDTSNQAPDAASAVLDDAGGRVALDDFWIDVPAGALDAGTRLTIRRVGPAPDRFAGATSLQYAVEPEDLELALPATVAFRVGSTMPGEHVHWTALDGYAAADGPSVDDDVVRGLVHRLGRGFVAPLGEQTEAFAAEGTTPLSILLVPDGREVAIPHHAKLEAMLAHLVTRLSDGAVDWHVGMVPADSGSGALGHLLRTVSLDRWISSATQNRAAELHTWLDLHVAGVPTREFLAATMAVYSTAYPSVVEANDGFDAEGGQQLFVYLAGADDLSAPTVRVNDFVTWAKTYEHSADDVHALTFTASEGAKICDGELRTASRLVSATEALGGTVEEICAPDWAPAADRAVDQLAATPCMRLRFVAAPDSVGVHVVTPTHRDLVDGEFGVRVVDGETCVYLTFAGLDVAGDGVVAVTSTP